MKFKKRNMSHCEDAQGNYNAGECLSGGWG